MRFQSEPEAVSALVYTCDTLLLNDGQADILGMLQMTQKALVICEMKLPQQSVSPQAVAKVHFQTFTVFRIEQWTPRIEPDGAEDVLYFDLLILFSCLL